MDNELFENKDTEDSDESDEEKRNDVVEENKEKSIVSKIEPTTEKAQTKTDENTTKNIPENILNITEIEKISEDHVSNTLAIKILNVEAIKSKPESLCSEQQFIESDSIQISHATNMISPTKLEIQQDGAEIKISTENVKIQQKEKIFCSLPSQKLKSTENFNKVSKIETTKEDFLINCEIDKNVDNFQSPTILSEIQNLKDITQCGIELKDVSQIETIAEDSVRKNSENCQPEYKILTVTKKLEIPAVINRIANWENMIKGATLVSPTESVPVSPLNFAGPKFSFPKSQDTTSENKITVTTNSNSEISAFSQTNQTTHKYS
ncbi:hypothetical protein HK096_008406, partial [Nowakowskiella sp. JEL0078]